jgi:hypothetical protein
MPNIALARDIAGGREEIGESIQRQASLVQLTKKYYNSQTKKIKLNSDYTIEFVSINSSKQDLT